MSNWSFYRTNPLVLAFFTLMGIILPCLGEGVNGEKAVSKSREKRLKPPIYIFHRQ